LSFELDDKKVEDLKRSLERLSPRESSSNFETLQTDEIREEEDDAEFIIKIEASDDPVIIIDEDSDYFNDTKDKKHKKGKKDDTSK
jgi:hypothetical protein